MRRIGFRRLLPPVQPVLFGSFLWVADWEKQRRQPCFEGISLTPSVYAQEQPEIPFRPPCRSSKAELVAMGVNLPAVFAGLLTAAALRHDTDRWQNGASTPAVVLLWYWVGLWIDRHLGYVAAPQRRRRYPLFLLRAAFALCLLFFLLSALRWAVGSNRGVEWVTVTSALGCWSGFLFAVVWSNRHRALATVFAEPPKEVSG